MRSLALRSVSARLGLVVVWKKEENEGQVITGGWGCRDWRKGWSSSGKRSNWDREEMQRGRGARDDDDVPGSLEQWIRTFGWSDLVEI
ncbi:hypothetical protein ACH5RR_036733 [Cinchona calisaya]|uniref:Uncharacterized protein n=1 Tax=Cinchona calisaya TaxID=153742 RepID=A0ABD2Y7N8_9GENT